MSWLTVFLTRYQYWVTGFLGGGCPGLHHPRHKKLQKGVRLKDAVVGAPHSVGDWDRMASGRTGLCFYSPVLLSNTRGRTPGCSLRSQGNSSTAIIQGNSSTAIIPFLLVSVVCTQEFQDTCQAQEDSSHVNPETEGHR